MILTSKWRDLSAEQVARYKQQKWSLFKPTGTFYNEHGLELQERLDGTKPTGIWEARRVRTPILAADLAFFSALFFVCIVIVSYLIWAAVGYPGEQEDAFMARVGLRMIPQWMQWMLGVCLAVSIVVPVAYWMKLKPRSASMRQYAAMGANGLEVVSQ